MSYISIESVREAFDECNRQDMADLKRQKEAILAATRAEKLLFEYYSNPARCEQKVVKHTVSSVIYANLNGTPMTTRDIYLMVREKMSDKDIQIKTVSNSLAYLKQQGAIVSTGKGKSTAYTKKA